MDELKKDMVRLDMLMESDFQIMSRLVSQFNSSNATVEEKVKALHDLEYLVHQVRPPKHGMFLYILIVGEEKQHLFYIG